MKITLITATYNSASTLTDCLQSVIDQDYPNIEHMLVDGGSTDDTVSQLKKIQEKHGNVRWVSESDRGIYDALNKGIAMASGDVIGFVHSDDLLADRGIISKVMKTFETESADGVYGNLLYVNKTDLNKILRVWESCAFHPKLLQQGWMPAHPTVFLKKEVYEKHGNFNLGYKIAADYDFMLRILKDPTYKFAFLPQVITKMRMGGASNRSLRNLVQKSTEDYKAMKSNGLSFPLWVLLSKNVSKIPQFIKSKI